MASERSRQFVSLRDFPSVEILSNHSSLDSYTEVLTRPLVVKTVKKVITELKEKFKKEEKAVNEKSLITAVTRELDRLLLLNLEPVINGTGIVIHTNLGRSPVSKAMIVNSLEMVTGYSNLEFNLATGKRGKRGVLVEKLLATLCGTEAGAIVNSFFI